MIPTSEGDAVYDMLVSQVTALGGVKNAVLSLRSGITAIVKHVLLSVDAKAAKQIFKCNAANSANNFCPFGCKISKARYSFSCL